MKKTRCRGKKCVRSKLVKGRVGWEEGRDLAGTPAAWVRRRRRGEQRAGTASCRGQRAGQSEQERGPGAPAVRQSAQASDTGGLRNVQTSGRTLASVREHQRDMGSGKGDETGYVYMCLYQHMLCLQRYSRCQIMCAHVCQSILWGMTVQNIVHTCRQTCR